MKNYKEPHIKINHINHEDVICTSEPVLFPDGDASEDYPVLAPNRDADWDNW